MGRCSTCAVWTATVSTPELVFAALESLRSTADLMEGSVQRFIPDPRAKVSGVRDLRMPLRGCQGQSI